MKLIAPLFESFIAQIKISGNFQKDCNKFPENSGKLQTQRHDNGVEEVTDDDIRINQNIHVCTRIYHG